MTEQQSVAEDTVPRSDTAQIRAIIQQAEVAVAQALAGESDAQRALLSQQLEKVARQAEDGEDAESPWLALAVHLRALAKKLSESGASTVRHTS